jgi:hypothetical protein
MNPSNLTLTSCSRRLKVEIITDIRSEQYHQSTSRHQRIASHELINYMYQLTAERPFGLPYQAVGRKYSFIVVSSPDYLSAFRGVLFCQWTELNWTELNWTELNWTELNWTELNWTELNWTELNWIGHVLSCCDIYLYIVLCCHACTCSASQCILLISYLDCVPPSCPCEWKCPCEIDG